MYCLDENYNPITDVEGDVTSYFFWTFQASSDAKHEADFFLEQAITWYGLKTEAYHVQVGKSTILLPANYFVVLADVSAGLDTITPHEICGRDFEVLTFNRTLDEGSWDLKPIRIVGYESETYFTFPSVKVPFPVVVNQSISMLLSEPDPYKMIRDLSFSEVI